MVEMVITTFDVPKDLLRYMDSLVDNGTARSRREIVIRALEFYKKYDMHEWDESFIVIRGLRRAFMTQRSVEQLTLGMSEEDLWKAGKRMGQILKDSLLATFGKDSSMQANYPLALSILESVGLGKFTLDENRIVVHNPFWPKRLLHGYLEHGLGIKLQHFQTVEDMAIYQARKSPLQRLPGSKRSSIGSSLS